MNVRRITEVGFAPAPGTVIRTLLLALSLAGHAGAAFAALAVGAPAPDFSTQAALGGKTHAHTLEPPRESWRPFGLSTGC